VNELVGYRAKKRTRSRRRQARRPHGKRASSRRSSRKRTCRSCRTVARGHRPEPARVPSRMNIGQVLESTRLGRGARRLRRERRRHEHEEVGLAASRQVIARRTRMRWRARVRRRDPQERGRGADRVRPAEPDLAGPVRVDEKAAPAESARQGAPLQRPHRRSVRAEGHVATCILKLLHLVDDKDPRAEQGPYSLVPSSRWAASEFGGHASARWSWASRRTARVHAPGDAHHQVRRHGRR